MKGVSLEGVGRRREQERPVKGVGFGRWMKYGKSVKGVW